MELPKAAQLIVGFARCAGAERLRSAYLIEPVPFASPDTPLILGDFGLRPP